MFSEVYPRTNLQKAPVKYDASVIEEDFELWQARDILTKAIEHDLEVLGRAVSDARSDKQRQECEEIKDQIVDFEHRWHPLLEALKKQKIMLRSEFV